MWLWRPQEARARELPLSVFASGAGSQRADDE